MLVGGVDAEGMALENEVGLFAMKRDQVFRAIRPLDDAGIEIDFIQLSPVAVFNTAVHNVMGELPPLSEYDQENPARVRRHPVDGNGHDRPRRDKRLSSLAT